MVHQGSVSGLALCSCDDFWILNFSRMQSYVTNLLPVRGNTSARFYDWVTKLDGQRNELDCSHCVYIVLGGL